MKTMKTAVMCLVFFTAIIGLSAQEKASGPAAESSTDTAKAQTPKAKDQKSTPGFRGFTLPVGAEQLLYLKKGDRVDILMTFNAKTSDTRKEKVTATIIQNVLVVNIHKSQKKNGLGAVEILCNPSEAQYLALSDVKGDIHLAVRAPGDEKINSLDMASFRKLIK